jgi:hypothetical protein
MIPNSNGPIFLIHDLANFYENEILYQKRPKITMMKKYIAQRTYFIYVYGKIDLP